MVTREHVLREREFERLLLGAGRLSGTDRIEARAAVLIMGRLGLRGGELIHLSESWIDWRHHLVRIPDHDSCTKGRDGGVCGSCRQAAEQRQQHGDDRPVEEIVEDYWQPKTDAAVRDIPFDWSVRVEVALEELLDEFDGWPTSFSTLQRRLECSLEAAPELSEDATTVHGLRGTAASYHAGNGLEMQSLKGMFGWRDNKTPNKYLSIDGEMVRRGLQEVY